MPITEKQRELRKNHIGSSDMAAIMGEDEYKTAYDVWLEKTGQLEPLEPTGAMEAGTRFEVGVLDYAEKDLGKIRRGGDYSSPKLHLRAHPDAVVVAAKEPVEGKTAGLFGPLKEGDWGDFGTDEVPSHVYIQAHVHMLCMKASNPSVCHVPAFLGGRGFGMFYIPRDKELCDAIGVFAVRFWERHVVPKVPPEDVAPTLSVIKRVKRIPETVAEIDPDMVAQWERAKCNLATAKRQAEATQAAILGAMGSAEGATFGDSERSITYLQQTRKAYQVKESKYRVLRVKKAKGK